MYKFFVRAALVCVFLGISMGAQGATDEETKHYPLELKSVYSAFLDLDPESGNNKVSSPVAGTILETEQKTSWFRTLATWGTPVVVVLGSIFVFWYKLSTAIVLSTIAYAQ